MCLDVQSGGFWSPLNHAAVGFVKTIQPHDVHNIIPTKQKKTKKEFHNSLCLKKKTYVKDLCSVPDLVLLSFGR